MDKETNEAREEAARLRADLNDAYAQIGEIADAVLDADCGLPPLADAVRGLTAHRNELRARVAALEAALRVVGSYDHSEDCAGRYDEHGDVADEDEQDDLCDCTTGEATRAISGGTAALDAAVAAAVAAERAAIRARVEALWSTEDGPIAATTYVDRDDVLSAIGGAP